MLSKLRTMLPPIIFLLLGLVGAITNGSDPQQIHYTLLWVGTALVSAIQLK